MRHPLKCLVTVVIYVTIVVTACHRRPQAVTAPPPAPTPIIVRVDAPDPIYSPIPTSLPIQDSPPLPGTIEREQADKAFVGGSYDEAIRGYEFFLMASPDGHRDEVMFRLGLSYMLRNSDSDWRRASTILKDLVKEYPGSFLKAPASLILTLRSQAEELAGDIRAREQAMKQLSVELERLKRIDADRGRRF